jgi:hypothetical protein
MINIQSAAGHVVNCTADLADCFECQSYVLAEPEAVGDAVLKEAWRILEHAIAIVEAALPVPTKGQDVMWSVMYVSPDGISTVVDTFTTEAEARDAAEYANQTRDAAQSIDGTLYEVRPATVAR